MKIVNILVLFIFLSGCGFLEEGSGFSVTGGPGELAPRSLKVLGRDRFGLRKVTSVAVHPLIVSKEVKDFKDEKKGDLQKAIARTLKEELTVEVANQGSYQKEGPNKPIFVVELLDFIERAGSDIGATRPAKVGMHMSLIGSNGEDTLWSASYVFHDKGWTDNLFQVRQKNREKGTTRWESALEIFTRGVQEGARELNRSRDWAFRKKE